MEYDDHRSLGTRRCMTRPDPDNEGSFHVCVIGSDQRETAVAKDAIIHELERHHYSEDTTFGIKLALEEALANAVKHGNRADPDKKVTVSYAVSDEKVVIIVRDEGSGFKPENIPDCTEPERLPIPNGRGIMLIRSYMDEVCYRDNGREIYFMKRRK